MQPYQEANEEILRQKGAPFKAAGKALGTAASLSSGSIGTAATLAGGSALFNKIAPFLSKHIPQDLTIKALSKIDPRLGKFVGNALKNEYTKDEISEFLKEKTSESKKKENAQENRNIIEQYSPELNQFIKQFIEKGENPLQAGARARLDKKYSDIIKNIEKDHKSDWSSILQTVYGGQDQSNQNQQPQQPQEQGGQGQQALISILQKIQQSRGG